MGKSILNLEEKQAEVSKYMALLIEKYNGECTEEQTLMIEEAFEALSQALDPKVDTNLEAYIPE
jgi:hypothetical protein